MKHELQITAMGERELAMTRVFDAPRALVWRAMTEPELVKRWLGVRNGWTLDVCQIDLRVGGALRYVWRGPQRKQMGMDGVFREIAAPERMVHTEHFDDPWFPGEALDTTVLVEKGGKTTLTLTSRYESRDARDSVLNGPSASGVAESYDVLDQILASLR